ncbi:MAG: translation elongation factor Ts [Vicinamibacterales bacterium]|jgi:elongation factor Ts|nr:translation elongation factor Ts [Acidobacteriota bacterium]MDP7294184.1 translation elongation factor Ts [Vicinamibacterales bacterium]MDP7472177.1 translation elongation factor Ts [Vicinamibacterales bacterium]MDP7671424.1 translation elongation factor Ts [Vicinamibacterales bacterium]HJO39293.1 translation elongation factor Ts [Vicinamibacterales bacterium]|tara:strand:- start:2265 stop:2861 length:597 start_codon:yes stop_codon:yes gene_type:complete
MSISATDVKALRDKTGAGFMECKSALAEANGDTDEAMTILRTRGVAKAAKRAGRSTDQGLVGSYIHTGGRVGVLIEVNCETDFVARTDDFQQLVKELAMHVAAANPTYVQRDEVPAETLEHEKGIFRAQLEEQKKPAHVIDKIIEGKIESYFKETVLLDQPSIRDPKTPVSQLVAAAIAKMGENVTISRFARFKLGEA